MVDITPFRVHVSDGVLQDLAIRLDRARLPQPGPDSSGWAAGVDANYLRDIVTYWRNDYDWRQHESRLNRIRHYHTEVDGLSLHFAHIRSRHENAIPLLMVHGWPGSIVEFLEVIDPLVAPEKHGGNADDAVHVVLPSLPGYGFSGIPKTAGWGIARTADAFVTLMRRLGYERFLAQGGDWGGIVTSELAARYPEHVLGLHTNMPVALPPPVPVQLDARGSADLSRTQHFMTHGLAYALEQGSRPETIGAALEDSPVGLCAWIIEKFHGWSDRRDTVSLSLDRDTLLTNVMLYWVTATATSAARYYREYFRGEDGNFDPGAPAREMPRVSVPTAVARYPAEVTRPPRAWVEHRYNIVSWTEMPRGGHFAALEQPALFTKDFQQFVSWIRRNVDVGVIQ